MEQLLVKPASSNWRMEAACGAIHAQHPNPLLHLMQAGIQQPNKNPSEAAATHCTC